MGKLYIYSFFTGLIFDRTLWILYLTEYNFSSISIGIFQTFLNLTMFFVEIPSGIISDKIGAKLTLILSHLFIIIYLLLMLIPLNSYGKIIGFISYGVGLSLTSGADQSLIYQILEKKKEEVFYQKIIGLYNSVGLFSMTFAIFLSGLIQKFSWSWIYLCTILFQILSIFTLITFQETNLIAKKTATERNSVEKILQNLKKYLKMKRAQNYRYIVFLIAFIEGVLSVLYMFGQLLLKNTGLENSKISMVFGIISIITIIILSRIYNISKVLSKEKIIKWCLYFLFVSFFLMITKSKIIVISTFIIIHVIYAIIDNSLNVILHEEIPSDLRTTLVSVANFFVQLVMVLAFPVISFLNKYYSILDLTIISGLITIVISILLNHKINKRRLPYDYQS